MFQSKGEHNINEECLLKYLHNPDSLQHCLGILQQFLMTKRAFDFDDLSGELSM